ncbi:putative cytokinetic ring protein SteA [Brevibacillus ginsengisoli]|uniref:putative cytokinetic ring protein SteA n=1 Tax=Brevibacillus ginsengisoli TaxID=363854 RepID=UPI003CEC81F3
MGYLLQRKRTNSQVIVATVVVDQKTKQLCMRIQPGQIAIIAHEDVDEVAAEALIEANVRAVINTKSFMTGTYPSIGAKRLLESKIPLFEVVGDSPMEIMSLQDQSTVRITTSLLLQVLHHNGWATYAQLAVVTPDSIWKKTQIANAQLDRTLSQFIDNTLMYAKWEKDIFLKPLPKLSLQTQIAGRHVIVVVRGKHYREDLQMLSSYIKECRPVLIAVDGGADALLESGYQPDLIIGDMDSISDDALRCGAEIVVHAFVNGYAPGHERVERLQLVHQLLPAPGTSEDVAMLLAYEEDAELIVTIGTHTNMIDFLEKGRKGMASTLLVRTKIGPKLIDAKGVSQLYQPRVTANTWALFMLASLAPIMAILAINPVIRNVLNMFVRQWMMLTF